MHGVTEQRGLEPGAASSRAFVYEAGLLLYGREECLESLSRHPGE